MVWKAQQISLKLKKQLVKLLIWSTALYGSESWTLNMLKEADKRSITAFEMWVWRRVLHISWTDMKTNKWIPNQIGVKEDEGLLTQVKTRKISKYGHWKRRGESLV